MKPNNPLLPPKEWHARWPNFRPEEFTCSHCGKHGIKSEVLDLLQAIRDELKTPVIVTSGYRCEDHPTEAKKQVPGAHTHGLAVDISCGSLLARRIVKVALSLDVPRIGISQRMGAPRFVHLDLVTAAGFPEALYSY